MEMILSARDLCKSYGHFQALKGLSLEIPKGAIYGLVGRNGAGKTTLIRLLCGLQPPDSGEFTLYGYSDKDVGIAKARRRMGAVVESPSIYLSLTARENLEQQYRVLGLPSFDGLEALLTLVGLGGHGEEKGTELFPRHEAAAWTGNRAGGGPGFSYPGRAHQRPGSPGYHRHPGADSETEPGKGHHRLISSHILDELSRLATHYGIIDGGRMVKALSAQELEKACRKCVRMEVTDTAALARVLDTMQAEYKILSPSTADVYAKVNVSQLAAALGAEGCQILSLQERDESLESYYISLVGGGDHA